MLFVFVLGHQADFYSLLPESSPLHASHNSRMSGGGRAISIESWAPSASITSGEALVDQF